MTDKICAKTGLALTESPVSAVRIARESFGPLDPRPRSAGEDVSLWSCYDTIERTVYASDDRLTSYMEMLAPYRTEIDGTRRALQKDADFMGVTLDDLWTQVVADWDEAGKMKARWLPRAFREGRAMYDLSFPPGWWIDITATETISAVNDRFSGAVPTAGGPKGITVTLAHIVGDDRVLTTAIAAWLREDVTLDDGSLPLGARFVSKHGRPAEGTGMCWAYWMRAADVGLTEPTTITSSAPIEENDPDLAKAQNHCNITIR